MIIVSIGNAFDGITLHGPFETFEGAQEWAESNTDEDWHTLRVYSVEDADSWDYPYLESESSLFPTHKERSVK